MRQTLSYLLWLGQQPEHTLRSISSRLRFKSDLKKLLIATSKLNQALPKLVGASPSTVVRECDKAPRLAIYGAYLINTDEELRQPLWHYIDQWSAVEPHTTGEDLRNIGLRPSPAYGRILTSLRDAWLDGKIKSVEEERALLAKLVAEAE